MYVSSRRKQQSILPYRVTLWTVVAIVALTVYFDHSPIALDGEWTPHAGLEITREAGADIVVVLDYEAIRTSGTTFSTRDWSAVWINLIEQEVGPVTIATPASLSQKMLGQARVVVLTSSVSKDMGEGMLRTLRQWVLEGNLIVLDQPDGLLREAFSADGRAGSRRGQRITFARELASPFHEQLQQMPLSTSYIGSTAARSQATTLLSIDGAPAIYSAPIGPGTAVTIDFDIGEQLVALQQGRPSESFELRVPDRPDPSRVRTEDLILDRSLEGAAVPYADLLERFIVYGVIMRHAPLPTFWTYPGGAAGAVVLMHEDSQLGDGGGWMLDHEATYGAFSTLLTSVDAGLTPEGAERIHKKGGEIGILWRMQDTPGELREAVGIGRLEPAARPIDLATQVDQIKSTVPVNHVRSSRAFEGWWSPQWSAPFEALAAAGVRVDMSYGQSATSGYAFGTGLPFLAMSDEGMPLGVRAMPIVVPSRRIDGPDLEELLRTSRDGHHQAITVSTDPAQFADYPDADRFERWLAMFQLVQDYDHALTSVLRFDTFQRNRRAGSIQSRLVERAPLPDNVRAGAGSGAGAGAPPPGTPAAARAAAARPARALRVTVEAKSRGMSLVVPERIGDQSFVTARQGTRRVHGELLASELTTEPASIIGFELRRVPLEQGYNTIDIFYR